MQQFWPDWRGHCRRRVARVDCTAMTAKRVSALGQTALRRNAVWPWLVMPLVVLALFAVLHNVRRSGDANEQGSSFGGGLP
jgi:hypothetical protein